MAAVVLSGLVRGLGLALALSMAMAAPALAEQPGVGPQPVPRVVFENGNIYAVQNRPNRTTVVYFRRPVWIATITTYHWNEAQGARPGTIGLTDRSGHFYGPWRTIGLPGQGGVPNAYWKAHINIALPPGRYVVFDSDPATWAQNAGSRGAGFVTIEGSLIEPPRRAGPDGR